MQQLTQKLKKGEIEIKEVPLPVLSTGQVMVRNHYSLISAGTESSTVKTARKSLIGKAKERPQQVKQVLEVLKSQGVVQTYRAVMKKLDAYSPLGYSCAGEVIDVGPGVNEFQIGDRVACAGVTASHAEIICVPTNLTVKLDVDANLQHAAYNTLGAIALQGIRQADLRLGESCAVIGLGLLGQLTCLMLRSSGVQTYGVDINPDSVATAQQCTDAAWTRNAPDLADEISRRTGGLGVDSVIITAGTSSLDPINFAGEIARKKGRVVVVGAVPTGFDREPHYYRKELELRMSCSYGPGRYDLDYEEKGLDYPAAYVRWTEKRNMEAFQQLIATGKIDLGYLTTHEFPLAQAADAYNMILDASEPFLGVVLKYDQDRPLDRQRLEIRPSKPESQVGLAFIGAGSYAQGNLLPNLPSASGMVRRGVLTNSGTTSRRVAEKFGFEFSASDVAQILDDPTINTVFIATRHDSHGDYVQQALQAGKHVFVEKPVCLSMEQLLDIRETHAGLSEPRQLMVGFNRRFAPHAQQLKQRLGAGPLAATYRVNAGAIPGDSWIQDPDIGGGRIVGEGCHFIDLLTFLTGSQPATVYARAIPDPHHFNDSVSIQIEFHNGSIGTVHYFANGHKSMPKESVEVFQGGQAFQLDDYRSLHEYRVAKPTRHKSTSQDKGQARMVASFLESVAQGGESTIPAEEIFAVHAACFAALESLKTGLPVKICL